MDWIRVGLLKTVVHIEIVGQQGAQEVQSAEVPEMQKVFFPFFFPLFFLPSEVNQSS